MLICCCVIEVREVFFNVASGGKPKKLNLLGA